MDWGTTSSGAQASLGGALTGQEAARDGRDATRGGHFAVPARQVDYRGSQEATVGFRGGQEARREGRAAVQADQAAFRGDLAAAVEGGPQETGEFVPIFPSALTGGKVSSKRGGGGFKTYSCIQ